MLFTILIVYLVIVVLMSCVTFVAYGIDKRRARNQQRRISEKALHQCALCGGWPGAWIGQRVFRHKTQKVSFLVVYWAIVALHVSAIGWLLYRTMA